MGAAGREGKASWLRGMVFLGWEGWEVDEAHVERDDEDGAGADDAEGREGKADDDDGDDEDIQPGVTLTDAVGMGPPRRVLFLRRRTLLECFCAGAALGRPGFAAAAFAQPLELEVAPCMPLRPGRLG